MGDELDSTADIVAGTLGPEGPDAAGAAASAAAAARAGTGAARGAKVVVLAEGGHLAPVWVRANPAEVAKAALDPAAAALAAEWLDPRGEFRFGDDAALDALVDALAAWLIPGGGGGGVPGRAARALDAGRA